MARRILEVCVASAADAILAVANGADRLELNCALELGGLTPTSVMLAEIRPRVHVPLIAMIRPRAGDFFYSESEFREMIADAESVIRRGVDGIAFGVLTASGEIDVERNSILRKNCGSQAVFHRAFDATPDPFAALETLIDLGFNRILTSGQAATAHEGIPLILQLIERAAGRIEILPGAGINRKTAAAVVNGTGCDQVHGSFRKASDGSMDPDEVAAVRSIIDTCRATKASA